MTYGRDAISRRAWLTGCLTLLSGAVPAAVRRPQQTPSAASQVSRINSVRGPIAAADLGLTLMHEHVLVDFIGAASVSPSRYDRAEAFKTVLPYLQQITKLGCSTLVECTPSYLGRDPRLLKQLSEAAQIHILTNTGYYGAAQDKYVPPHAYRETAEQLAARWIREWERGIDDTGIKPAFMKIGVDSGKLSEIDAKLVRAAALTHRATRLPIASHTGDGVAAYEELAELERAGVPAAAFIWVHAQSERDEAFHIGAAKRGAWIEFDGISETSVQRHIHLVRRMKTEGFLARVLVSHDAGWYRVGEAGGGKFRPFDTLFTSFVPALKAADFTNAEIRQLLVDNPRAALSITGS